MSRNMFELIESYRSCRGNIQQITNKYFKKWEKDILAGDFLDSLTLKLGTRIYHNLQTMKSNK